MKKKMKRILVFTLICALAVSMTAFSPASAKQAQASTQKAQAASICNTCGGTGSTRCPVCGGLGGSYSSLPSYNSITGTYTTTSIWMACGNCGGRGSQICMSCHGTGTIGDSSYSGSGSSGSGSSSSSSDSFTDERVIDATKGAWDWEESTYLFDGDKETKYCYIGSEAYVIWKAPAKIKVSSYTIMTGNDNTIYEGRNPKSWVLYGSNKKLSRNDDGWKKIHSVTNDKKLKNKNFKNYTYKLKKAAKAYRYYKLEITDNKGADCTQLSAFTLKGVSDKQKVPAFTKAKKKGAKVTLAWEKVSSVSGYEIQYSTSAKFKNKKTVKAKKAGTVEKTIKLKKGKKYYLRIRTYKTKKGAVIYSKWSKAKKVKL